ncbi:uncharacterized protein LOC111266604 isoform X1 [Varroa jacobsoni]|uniref:uncharacterized protein LOC111266604 isoform X1 n=1 Tax=Varroa jacobsoni TaxID=62625 RepID=UPI000BF3954C|nr:uncharacterized protein LOC111266604 isoform X1 [Varroa jacobsoni]XP_022699956.1 uncharacterized protein LOC111266604 isoform X1 [Varroa jacobsoni]XP_022699957.1 uncharacterized protein LOC111266604 isoform X1 [Varroa jacobsoni]
MAQSISDLQEGRKVVGDCGSDFSPPKWLEMPKYKRGQELLKENIFATLFCHVGGLIMLVNVPSIYKLLDNTGNSRSLVSCFQRYLKTLTHVKSWYETDIFDASSEGFQSIKYVRGLHRKVAAAMAQQRPLLASQDVCESGGGKMNNRSNLEADPEVWISQWDMAMTQFAFLGMMILHPNVLGFSHLSRQDKEAVAHCWRCIGYQLGIDDKYNLFGSDNLHTIEKLCQNIEAEVFRPNLTANYLGGLRMGKTILESIRNIVHGLTYHGFMKFWSEVIGVRYLVRLSAGDWLSYVLISVVFRGRMFSMFPLRNGFNRLVLWAIERASLRAMTIYKDLCVRDNKGGVEVSACPFAKFHDYL